MTRIGQDEPPVGPITQEELEIRFRFSGDPDWTLTDFRVEPSSDAPDGLIKIKLIYKNASGHYYLLYRKVGEEFGLSVYRFQHHQMT